MAYALRFLTSQGTHTVSMTVIFFFLLPCAYITENTLYRNRDNRCMTSLATVATGVILYSLSLSKSFDWRMCQDFLFYTSLLNY